MVMGLALTIDLQYALAMLLIDGRLHRSAIPRSSRDVTYNNMLLDQRFFAEGNKDVRHAGMRAKIPHDGGVGSFAQPPPAWRFSGHVSRGAILLFRSGKMMRHTLHSLGFLVHRSSIMRYCFLQEAPVLTAKRAGRDASRRQPGSF